MDASVLRAVDRFLGGCQDPAGDAGIARFAAEYKIRIRGLLDDNDEIAYSKFDQFLQRVTMTADVLGAYLEDNPILSRENLWVVVGHRVEDAIHASFLDTDPRFHADDFPMFDDQYNAFYGALRGVTDLNNAVIRRIQEFKKEAAALRRAIRAGARGGAVYRMMI